MSNFNFFEIIKHIYTKKDKIYSLYDGLLYTLTKWLSLDLDTLPKLKRILPYLFRISPKSYYILLTTTVPFRHKPPFLKGYKKQKEVLSNELLEKIKKYFEWSNKELVRNLPILEKTVMTDQKFWEKEFGIDK